VSHVRLAGRHTPSSDKCSALSPSSRMPP
jgi:hypothetical protein